MAKFKEEQIQIHKDYLTIADMKSVATKYGYNWETLRNAMYGVFHHDTGDKKRVKMIQECVSLVSKRIKEAEEKAINDMEVITDKTVK